MSEHVKRRFPPGQHLLIDADDTLWENNVYFERAIADFISFLNHHEHTPDRRDRAGSEAIAVVELS